MKNLIIHPSDPTTDFLKPIYSNINDAIIVNGGVSKDQLTQLIKEHDRIIMMGHGSPSGLFAVGMFSDAKSSIYPQRFNYAHVMDNYELIVDENPVALYNYNRLYLAE